MKIFSTFLRYISILSLLSSFLIPLTFAEDTDCVIKNGMSEELVNYIQTTENLLSKIGEESSKKQCNTSGGNSASASASKAQSTIVGSMNESIGFSNFSTSGRFYIDIALKTEIPTGITRDHEQLGRELERINSVINLVHNRCAENIEPGSNLSEDPIYSTSTKTLGSILTEMLKNQVDMMNFYRSTVLGDKTDGAPEFILVGNPQVFKQKLQEHYGPQAFSKCNGKSDFFKDTQEKFKTIQKEGGGIDSGIKEWENAYDLYNSNSSNNEYANTERELLRGELSKQGMNTKASQAIMGNLEKYNNGGSNNGFSDFVESVGNRVISSIDQVGEIYKGLREKLLPAAKNTDEYMKVSRSIIMLQTGISEEIVQDYENAKGYIGLENMSNDVTLASLIDTHLLLETTNKALQRYIKISEQVCDSQITGEGNCSF